MTHRLGLLLLSLLTIAAGPAASQQRDTLGTGGLPLDRGRLRQAGHPAGPAR
jgi:hypothetical protein